MYSVIIPVYNEEQTIPELYARLAAAASPLDAPVEIVFVDDGSRDRSYELLASLHGRDARVKVLRLSRNFGHQIAISAGLEAAQGDAVVLMDGDLQDPPELLPAMVNRWKEGFAVVYTVKKSRRENPLKRFAFTSFYRILHTLSSIQIPMDAGNFSLLDRRVVDVLRAMPERNRYISGLRAWAGFPQTSVAYDRDPRFAGKPQMSLGRLVHLALDGIFSFSNVPLRLAIYIGLLTAALAFAGALYVVYAKLFTDRAILGWASTILSVLFVGGMILVTLGVIGEYISRIYEEVKKRPLYVVRDRIGF
ncbi:MAG TPA: glycosyltransferase family 2 protein [Bacteroidota bacterium]|nr:glycosyltransferase family 2 protein [Bacteroidota bacterium]